MERCKIIDLPKIVDRTIISAAVLNEQVIAYPDCDSFIDNIHHKNICSMGRRGKFLMIYFTDESRLTLHLRMTGQLLVMPKDYPVEKHTHLILDLSDSQQIRYIDVRRFGRFWFIHKDETDRVSGITKLGIEPFDKGLTAEYLKQSLNKRKKSIKEALLDQAVVTGIGNIYSDEILFAARIYPGTLCIGIKDSQWKKLARMIPAVLNKAIDDNRMTPEEYLAGRGKEYRNTPYFYVYGRDGEACKVCGEKLLKMVIAGRSCVYCPKCQK